MVGRNGRKMAGWALAGAAAFAALRALRRRPADIAGEVALVTGGSRGLGLLIARELARQGCRVALCARDVRELDAARADLEGRGAAVLAVPCDLADPTAIEAMVAGVTDHFGRIDVVVNNAGIIQVGPLETMTVEDFERIMAVNFWGALRTTLAVLPQMRARRSGRIVNITSIGGRIAIPHLLPYDCSKFALRGFSEGLRAELADEGITVTTIVPGLMRTGSPVNAFFKGRQTAEFTWFSLGDALPLTSMGAARAARRIVEAMRRGEAEVTLTWQARLAGLLHDLFPGATADLLGVVDRLLPRGDGAGTSTRRGMELASPLSPSPLTTLMNRAAREYHQFAGTAEPSPEHARRIGLA